MKEVVKSEKYGEIVFSESFWTGRKEISINGTQLKKIDKKTFEMADGQKAILNGNFLAGAKLLIGNDSIQIMPTVKWYDIVLSCLPFLLIMIWGNVVALCQIVPVVGGAIGGGISGLTSFTNYALLRKVKPIWLKVVISIIMLGVTFGICAGIGYGILAAYK